MFGRKKAHESKQAAHRAAEERTAKVAGFREQLLAREALDGKAARLSPAEKTRNQANSIAERSKNTPSV